MLGFDVVGIDRRWYVCLRRYLVPADLTVGQFVYVIRKRIKLSSEKAIFIFVKNVLPPTGVHPIGYDGLLLLVHMYVFECCELMDGVFLGYAAAMMSSIYDEHKDEDGFLYFTYSGENTFGDVITC